MKAPKVGDVYRQPGSDNEWEVISVGSGQVEAQLTRGPFDHPNATRKTVRWWMNQWRRDMKDAKVTNA